MADAELGNLIIKISTDVSDIKKGMEKAKKDTDSFGKSIANTFKAIGAALVVREVVQFGKEIIELGDQLNTLSKKTGLAASQIAALRFAASQSDTSIEAIAGNIRVLAKNMDDAARGNEAAREVFKRFHIEYSNGDGTLRNYRDVLVEVADRISNTKDKATALAAAQQLLGRNAQETFNFFEQGGEAIRKLEERYFSLGASRDEIDKLAKQADELKDSWDEVSKQFEIVGMKVMIELMPHIKELADWMLEKDWTKFTDFLGSIVNLATDVADTFGQIVGWMEQMSGLMSGKTFEEVYGKQPGGILDGEDAGKIAANRKQIIDSVYGGKDPGAGKISQLPDTPATKLDEVLVTASPLGSGPAGATGQGIDAAAKIKETQNALEKLAESWKDVNKQITDSLANTLEAITSGFGSAIAEVIVDGKDFGEAMKELWKDIAKQIISEIVRIIAQLIILHTWQTLTGTQGAGGGGIRKLFGFDKGGVIGARNGLVSGGGAFETGHQGEGGIPAIVHPGEIISPIDKFFDAIQKSGPKNFNITVNGNTDPALLSQMLALEIDRKSRGV